MTHPPPPPPEADDWDGQLARLYAELTEHQRRGAREPAEALRGKIAALLGEAVQTSFAAGTTCRAERRDREAFFHLAMALDLHRWRPSDLTLPVSPAACYRALGALYQDWGQPLAVAAATMLALRGASFYGRPPLCQIPILDGLYEQLFGQRRDGCFVEVGAFDGESYGNTATLADLGWRGLYIEPVPASYRLCCQRHAGNPQVTVLDCAIGETEGTTPLWVAREFSTVTHAHIDHGVAGGWMPPLDYQRIEVPQLRLETALTQARIEPGFELLVVDVEGAEEAVFASFDLDHWRPVAMIVELVGIDPTGRAQPDSDDPVAAAARRVRTTIEAAGYDVIYADHTNTMFRRRT